MPDDVVFQTKPQIALDLIDRAKANGIEVIAWTADELHGRDGAFLDALDARGEAYVLEVPPNAKDVRVEHGKQAGWLSPIAQEPPRKKVRDKRTRRRVSNKGCLPMTLPESLQLVDWTGRQLHRGKRGRIPKDVPPVIERLGSSAEIWMHFVRKFSGRRNVQSITPVNQQAVAYCLQSPAEASA